MWGESVAGGIAGGSGGRTALRGDSAMGPESEGGGPGSEPPPGSVMQAHGRAQRSVPRPPCPSRPTGCCCCSHPARQGGVGTRASGWIRPPWTLDEAVVCPTLLSPQPAWGPSRELWAGRGPTGPGPAPPAPGVRVRSGASTTCSGGARRALLRSRHG